MEDEEHEVYGGEIPDVADMDADVDMTTRTGEEAVKLQELDEMKKRLKEMEEEAAALREMQAKVEKEMGGVPDPASAAATQASKEEVDSRSVFVGNKPAANSYSPLRYIIEISLCILLANNPSIWSIVSDYPSSYGRQVSGCPRFYSHQVDYSCTPEEVQQHFQACGTVNRVTILTDKFGQPKGFAYVEFLEVEAVQEALNLNESELHGRQLKVSPKRTNVPGMKQFRPHRFNPYVGSRFRRPFMPYYSPFGYGKFPRFRRPMPRYMPYY